MLTVDKCCCGCTLRTGSIMIAIFYLEFVRIPQEFLVRNVTRLIALIYEVKSGVATILFPFLITERLATGLKIVLTIIAVMYGAQFLTNFMLLVAIFGDKRVLFIPWIIIQIIMSTWTTISHFVSAIAYLILQSRVVLGVSSLLFMVLILGIQVYFLVVVYSLYMEIKDQ